MGSTSTYRPKGISHRDFFHQAVLYPEWKILADNTSGNVYYAAVQKDDIIFGLVCHFNWSPNASENFWYKAMDETQGPYFYGASEKVIKLLTPTDHEYANEWRLGCLKEAAWKNAASKIEEGDIVKSASPIRFTNGEEVDTFTVLRAPYGVRRPLSIAGYNLGKDWRLRMNEIRKPDGTVIRRSEVVAAVTLEVAKGEDLVAA